MLPLAALLILGAGSDSPELGKIAKGFAGRAGVCLVDGSRTLTLRGEERFSLQSVVKLIVSAAVLDQVDRGRFKLTDRVRISRADISVHVQPIAERVRKGPAEVTIGELIRSAVIDSDSMANDVLYRKLGGAVAVNRFLAAHGIRGMRVDRSERELQTETVGLTWRAEFLNPARFEAAEKAVPSAVRMAALRRYQKDVRDTTTPRAMGEFLGLLLDGRLLEGASTRFLLKAMADCRTGADRLSAGVKPGWSLGHKTGSSGTYHGITVATNDVGILTGPDGRKVILAVLLGDSTATDQGRAKLMQRFAAFACRAR